jgi:hypothetical protein
MNTVNCKLAMLRAAAIQFVIHRVMEHRLPGGADAGRFGAGAGHFSGDGARLAGRRG